MEKKRFSPIPRLDFILNNEEFLLKASKTPESPQEFITKKRKLSDYSEISTNTKNESLNESFLNLTLASNSNSQFHLSEVKIPKPIRNCKDHSILTSSNKEKILNDSKENVFKKFAIEKNLNYFPETYKGKTISYKTISNLIDSKNLSSKTPTFLYLPFGVPMNVIDLLMKIETKKENENEEKVRFVGPLTVKERNEKLRKYQEKKKNRKWKSIRYNIRKDLADQRERFQGRFVKRNRSTNFFVNNNNETETLEMKSMKI